MDLYTPDPDLRSGVGRALPGQAGQFVLQAHLCTVWQNGQYKATRDIGEVRASFEDMLRRLETDYIDVGMIHYVDTMDTWNTVANGEVMRYALEQKRAGRIPVHRPEQPQPGGGAGGCGKRPCGGTDVQRQPLL